jgi:hypothetical protein
MVYFGCGSCDADSTFLADTLIPFSYEWQQIRHARAGFISAPVGLYRKIFPAEYPLLHQIRVWFKEALPVSQGWELCRFQETIFPRRETILVKSPHNLRHGYLELSPQPMRHFPEKFLFQFGKLGRNFAGILVVLAPSTDEPIQSCYLGTY